MRLPLCWCPRPSRAICRVSRNAGPTLVHRLVTDSPNRVRPPVYKPEFQSNCMNTGGMTWMDNRGMDPVVELELELDGGRWEKTGARRRAGNCARWRKVDGGCNFHSLNLRREEITFGRCNWRIGYYSRMGIIDCSRELGYFPCEKIFENVLPIVSPSFSSSPLSSRK